MRSARIVMMAVLGMLALSVASSRGQISFLNLPGTIKGSLTGETLFNSANSANDGTVSSWVVSASSVNSGGYIFIYQVENQGPDDITGVNFDSFMGGDVLSAEVYSNVNVNFNPLPSSTSTGGEFAQTFSFDTVTSGGAATFNGDLPMGATSWFVVIETDVTSMNDGYALTQDNFQAHGEILAENVATYSTPEPSWAALMLLAGCACFYAVLRSRRAIDS